MTSSRVVICLGPEDVLMGRGSPATASLGNIRFRQVIKTLLPLYTSTNRRSVKDRLAKAVVEIICSRNGRFLRRIESPLEAEQLNLPSYDGVWLLVEEKYIIPKVKQTFRDQHAGTKNVEAPAQRSGIDAAAICYNFLRDTQPNPPPLASPPAASPGLYHWNPAAIPPWPAVMPRLLMPANLGNPGQRKGTPTGAESKLMQTDDCYKTEPTFRCGLELLAGVASKSEEIVNTTKMLSDRSERSTSSTTKTGCRYTM